MENSTHGQKSETNELCPICLQAVINRYKKEKQQSADQFVVAYPAMGRVICLYTYASYTGNSLYEQMADDLLDGIYEKINIISSIGQERCLSGIGCGLIYLLKNGFVKGDEDEILKHIDYRLCSQCFAWSDSSFESLFGWIHYLWLRVKDKAPDDDDIKALTNRQNLICYLDYLKVQGLNMISPSNAVGIKEIEEIHASGLCPVLTERILSGYRNQSKEKSPYSGESMEEGEVTFVIPLRIDSVEREMNLDIVLTFLSERKNTSVLVLEADVTPHYKMKSSYPNVSYRFVKDEDPIFHRTRYLNELLREARTLVVGIWDTDVIVPETQIEAAIREIQTGRAIMSFPYDGRFGYYSAADSSEFREKRSVSFLEACMCKHVYFTSNAVGGAFLVNRTVYLGAGGENEHFYAWGVEDLERVKRMEILDLPVYRAKGPLFHLYHPQSGNSGFHYEPFEIQNRKEFQKECRMTKNDLLRYIRTWE